MEVAGFCRDRFPSLEGLGVGLKERQKIKVTRQKVL
jgi:hypothetical protein